MNLTPQQLSYLKTFIARYTQRTQKSKQQELAYRRVFADFRTLDTFRLETKEMCYPISAQASHGSRMWDLDGNEYIDLTMGFGVNLFGYQPEFVIAAIQEQLKSGLHVGPQSNLAGEVSLLITEMTKTDRVAFCNSGTEAVMIAIRLARATTGREKIVTFTGSYHGHADNVLSVPSDDGLGAKPVIGGVSTKTVEDNFVLPYGTDESLNIIKAHAHELAAVLVEPVQSHKPDLQPKEFLKELREITKASGVMLIFDEIITGFRTHPGGVQAYFGIKADIVTYGKTVGGGMPIGIVAGNTACLDRIDGGWWQYGDLSIPTVPPTFYAGTFCKHPLAMVAARAVLKHLKQQGPALQQQLNQRTTQLAETLNVYFKQNNLSLSVTHFSSFFRFESAMVQQDKDLVIEKVPIELDLLYSLLTEKGIYIWEGRTCFLSTAHSNEEVEYIIKAVKDSIEELQANGFYFTT